MTDESNPDDLLFVEVQDALQTKTAPGTAQLLSSLTSIDNREIVRELHRDGQGIVYESLQQNPPGRVALKVLLYGQFSSVIRNSFHPTRVPRPRHGSLVTLDPVRAAFQRPGLQTPLPPQTHPLMQ